MLERAGAYEAWGLKDLNTVNEVKQNQTNKQNPELQKQGKECLKIRSKHQALHDHKDHVKDPSVFSY